MLVIDLEGFPWGDEERILHPLLYVPQQLCSGFPTLSFCFIFRALLQGLAYNSQISDLHLDLSNCEVRT